MNRLERHFRATLRKSHLSFLDLGDITDAIDLACFLRTVRA